MAFTPWIEHQPVAGRCERCGLPVPSFAEVAGKAYYHEAVGWLGEIPKGAIEPCGVNDGRRTSEP